MSNMRSGLHQHLARLDEIFATRGDYVQTLQFMQQMADNVIKQLLGLSDWEKAKVDLASIADQSATIEYYRWGTEEYMCQGCTVCESVYSQCGRCYKSV